jgi:thiamine monophosphate synthase
VNWVQTVVRQVGLYLLSQERKKKKKEKERKRNYERLEESCQQYARTLMEIPMVDLLLKKQAEKLRIERIRTEIN